MSACPRDSSNTKLSSRLSGMHLPCRLFSCPPPHTLEKEKQKWMQEEITKDHTVIKTRRGNEWKNNWRFLFSNCIKPEIMLITTTGRELQCNHGCYDFPLRSSCEVHHHGDVVAAHSHDLAALQLSNIRTSPRYHYTSEMIAFKTIHSSILTRY